MEEDQFSSRNSGPNRAASPKSAAPQVCCDLREAPMPTPETPDGVILGLLVCTQCVEDSIDARAFEPRCEMGLVGSGGGRQ